MGIRSFLDRFRTGDRRDSAQQAAPPESPAVHRLSTFLRTAGLDELSALGGVHMQLTATGHLGQRQSITRAMSQRLQADGVMDATALAIRAGVLTARRAISTALDAAPMRASPELEHHILEAATDLGSYAVICEHLDAEDRRLLTAPYVDLWPELADHLPGLETNPEDTDELLRWAESFGDLGSLSAGGWDDALRSLLEEAAAIDTDHARAFESIHQFSEQAWSEDEWRTIEEATTQARDALAAAGRDVSDRIQEIEAEAGEAASQALRYSAMLSTEHLDTQAQLRADDRAMFQAGSAAIHAERAALAVAARDLIDGDAFARLYFPWSLVIGGSEDDRSDLTYALDPADEAAADILQRWPLQVPALPDADGTTTL